MRYNKAFIRARFEIAMDALGVPHGPNYVNGKAQVGVYSIDHNSVYGGYCIRRISNEHGGESCPFGMERHSSSEFVTQLSAIIDAAYILKGNK